MQAHNVIVVGTGSVGKSWNLDRMYLQCWCKIRVTLENRIVTIMASSCDLVLTQIKDASTQPQILLEPRGSVWIWLLGVDKC